MAAFSKIGQGEPDGRDRAGLDCTEDVLAGMSAPEEIPEHTAPGEMAQSPDDYDSDFVVIPEHQSMPTSLLEPTPEINQRPEQEPHFSDLFSIFSISDHEREALQPILNSLSSTQDVLERLNRSIEERNVESQELRDSLREARERQEKLSAEHEQTLNENRLLKATQEELLAKVTSLEIEVKQESERVSLEQKKETEATQMQTEDETSLLKKERTELLEKLEEERASRESLMVMMAKLNETIQKAKEEAKEEVEKAKEETQKAEAELDAAKEEATNAREALLQESERRAEAEKKAAEATTERRTEAEKKAAEATTLVETLRADVERERQELLQQNISGSDPCLQRIAILENSLVSDTEARLRLEKSLEKAREESQKAREESQKAREESQKAREEARLEVERARADANMTMQELAQVLHRVDDFQSALTDARAQLERREAELEQRLGEKQNLEFMLEDCMNENRNLAEAVRVVQRERDELESENRALRIDYRRRLEEN
uniref:TACC_C domain-containing protein n=1 Tax=Steinernema glaseri TaxID=37863 RepID=A0A1I7YSK3_9BILA